MRDIQLAIRSARRRPFLTGIVVLTLALGLSLTTVVFSIADRVLFRELPYADPTQLLTLSTTLVERPGSGRRSPQRSSRRSRLPSRRSAA